MYIMTCMAEILILTLYIRILHRLKYPAILILYIDILLSVLGKRYSALITGSNFRFHMA